MLPLITGTLLAVLALVVVLAPLVSNDKPGSAADTLQRNRKSAANVEEEQGSAIAALREIEFDRETGKLSDADYADLKQRYTRAALDELRAAESQVDGAVAPSAVGVATVTPTLSIDDAVEAAIAKARASQRSCMVCGPRPEADAIYCSSCGRYLPGACGSCGASVELVGSRFCFNCGEQLAAA